MRRALAALLLVLAALAAGAPPAPAQQDDRGAAPVVAGQTPVVAPRGTFNLLLARSSLPADGTVTLVLHARTRSRSELAASAEGVGLRSRHHTGSHLVSELADAGGGRVRVSLSFDPDQPGGIGLSAAGVYPLEVIATAADGTEVGRTVTHVVLAPGDDDESPPLAIAPILVLPDDVPVTPDGRSALDDDEAADTAAWLGPAASRGRRMSIAAAPAQLEVLAAIGGPGATALLEVLGDLAAGSASLLPQPYAPVSPTALHDAGLEDELLAQALSGGHVLDTVLGARPDLGSWVADPALDDGGLEALASIGVRRLVVAPDQLEPLEDPPGLSLAHRFPLHADGEATGVEALAQDPAVMALLSSEDPPGAVAARVVAELAMLWFEQPGVPRAVPVVLTPDLHPTVLDHLLGAADGSVLEAVTVEEAFERASPLTQPGDLPLDRALDPVGSARAVPATVARALPELRATMISLDSALPDGSGALQAAGTHLLYASSSAVAARDAAAHLEAAQAELDALTGAVSTPDRETVTLTAREGTVPLALQNDSDTVLRVQVHLRSQKLEFPEGDVLDVELQPGRNRLDLRVRTRATGSFPLDIDVTTPDGGVHLTEVRHTIRSTAVSGMGIVLSAGAALFLMVWWARHWHQARRSSKLMEAKHLSHPSARAASASSDDAD